MENSVHQFALGEIVILKKKHPCGSSEWKVIRLGADLKLECCGCQRLILMPRIDVLKQLKK